MIGTDVLFLSTLLLNPGGLLGTELTPPDPGLVPQDTVSVSPLALARTDLPPGLTVRIMVDDRLAQRRRTPHPHPSPPTEQATDTEALPGSSSTSPPAATPGTDEPTAPHEAPTGQATSGSSDSTDDSCTDIDCDAYHEAERNSRYVLHRRGSLLRTHRAFAIAAWATMLVTEGLGTILAINQDTWFGRGNCAGDPSSFGCRDTSLIEGLHETAAFITEGLYTTAGVLAVAAPDPEDASVGTGEAESTLRLHKLLAWIHGSGMIALPILGILSMTPQMFGVTGDAARADFSRALRSIHTIVGYTTFAALTFSGYLELF